MEFSLDGITIPHGGILTEESELMTGIGGC